ncbi:MAG: YchJ family metal-binding protein [Thermodesulfobacteriota bacterium]|nr:YchJ family metal-binding protein [Thermodesulfobacteriota bacterium]
MIGDEPCPCQSGRAFSDCCELLMSGERPAETAKALMRSRYTAYVKGDAEYLIKSWHPSTRPAHIDPDMVPDWCSLVIKTAIGGGVDDTEGQVEFIATARARNRVVTLHEVSNFAKVDGRWLYVDGDVVERDGTVAKVGRNSPCPCGSGKKFKKCCGP